VSTASVIIATYNRASLLDECLQHLARQAFVPGDTVLIADNGSTDHTSAVVAGHASRFPVPLTRIPVATPGKSHAVSAALRMATGDIVALTDDDVNVSTRWLSQLKRGLSDSRVGLVGGPVDPRWERPAPAWLQVAGRGRLGAPLGLLDYGPEAASLGPRSLLGANMAVPRALLVQLGGYATHLGKLRGTLLSGEDHDLCQRVQAAGYAAHYLPDIRVQHWVPTTRMRLSYFLRWFYWSGITNATLDAGPAAGRARPGVPAHLVRLFAGGVLGLTASALRGQAAAAVDRSLDSAFAAGYAACRLGLVTAGAPASSTTARRA
jgi:GT2 family glycosyltransferase